MIMIKNTLSLFSKILNDLMTNDFHDCPTIFIDQFDFAVREYFYRYEHHVLIITIIPKKFVPLQAE